MHPACRKLNAYRLENGAIQFVRPNETLSVAFKSLQIGRSRGVKPVKNAHFLGR